MRLHTAPAIAAVLLTAACASTATHPTAASGPAVASTAPATTMPSPTPTPSGSATASSTAKAASNISLAAGSKSLPPGPFHITAISCGPYTKAQQDAFATNAKGGLIYRYANVSNSLTGAPSLDVDFLNGSSVLGDNVTNGSPDISPGQKAMGHVDALGGGQNLAFSSCELMEYGLRGTASANFAP